VVLTKERSFMIIIKNTKKVNLFKKEEFEQVHLVIEDHKIVDILSSDENVEEKYKKELEEANGTCQLIDAKGLFAGPGLVDVHVHFRDPGFTYKEDLHTGARAAARGGYTSVILMANTKPCVDNEETLTYILEKGKETPIHLLTCACITKGMKGEELVDMEYLKDQGAIGFTDDGVPILSKDLVVRAMEKAKELDVILSFHEEDPAYIKQNGINAGDVATKLGLEGSNREAEITMVKRDLELAMETGAKINLQHISTKEAVELIRAAKKDCNNIYTEATPHHIYLTQEAVLKHNTLAKMNPPLRTKEDQEAIVEGLVDGTIDFIATDHAPHGREEKERAFAEAPSGIIGLETAFSICMTALYQSGKMALSKIFERMSYAPSKAYGLEGGELEIGKPADLILFDPNEKVTYESFLSKSWNSPFLGETFYGKINLTICDGNIVYSDL